MPRGRKKKVVKSIKDNAMPKNKPIDERVIKTLVLTNTTSSDKIGFKKLVFSDEDDNLYVDDDYKNKYKAHYLKEIQADLDWYGKVYSQIGIKNKLFMDNEPPEKVVDRLITEYDLT